jgi:endogenous inhibitor of DNA gyrase (YacG/DUF329 family)
MYLYVELQFSKVDTLALLSVYYCPDCKASMSRAQKQHVEFCPPPRSQAIDLKVRFSGGFCSWPKALSCHTSKIH